MRNGKKTQAVDQAIHKYGWDKFKVEWLETNIPEDKLLEREAFHMRKHNTMAQNGYNILKPGVEVVSMHDPEVRARWELRNPEGIKKAVATLTAKREAVLAKMDPEDAAKLGAKLKIGRVREKKRHRGEELFPDARWTEETNAKKSKAWEAKRDAKAALMAPEDAKKYLRRQEWRKNARIKGKEKEIARRQEPEYIAYQKAYRIKNKHKILVLGS